MVWGGILKMFLKMFAAVKLYDKLRKWSKQIKYFNNNIQYMWPWKWPKAIKTGMHVESFRKVTITQPFKDLKKTDNYLYYIWNNYLYYLYYIWNNYLYYICNILTSSNLTISKLTDKLCKLQHSKFSHLCCFWCCWIKTCIINTGMKVKMSMHHATSVRKYWWIF